MMTCVENGCQPSDSTTGSALGCEQRALMAYFTPADNALLDTTPHPTVSFPTDPLHPKAPLTESTLSKSYLLSYLENRTPPLLRPCRQAYSIPDYLLLPHLTNLYPSLTLQQKLSFHLLYPPSATAHLITDTIRTSLIRVLIAVRRKVSGEIATAPAELHGQSRGELAIRFLMTSHTLAGIDRELVHDVLGKGGVKAAVEAGERVAGDTILDNGLTELEMVRGMGGVLHQALVGAEIEDRGGFVRIERERNQRHTAGEKIGKFSGRRVGEIGEDVDVEATLRRLAISEAQERLEEESSEIVNLTEGIEGGVYDDEIDDAVLEGESGLRALPEVGETEVLEEPIESPSSRAGASVNGSSSSSSGRGRGMGQRRGRGQGRGRGRGRGRGTRGRGARKNASIKKQNAGM